MLNFKQSPKINFKDLLSVTILPSIVNLSVEKIRKIVIVGSSCSGKTTLVNAVMHHPRILRPRRYITRPYRLGDDTVENEHVSQEKFGEYVETKKIAVHWTREMEHQRKTLYGFEHVEACEDNLLLYSANNGLLQNPKSVYPSHFFANDTLWIGVSAPRSVIQRRMEMRSPDLIKSRPDEAQHRLTDSLVLSKHVHVIIENHGECERTSSQDLYSLLERLK